MKKLISILLAVLMLFTLCACSKDSKPAESVDAPAVQAAESVPELTEAPVLAPAPNEEQPNAPPEDKSEAPSDNTDVIVIAEPTAEAPVETLPEPVPTEALPEPAEPAPAEIEEPSNTIDENGSYTSCDDVALYIHTYGKLPSNFITKKEAQALGWSGGSLEPYAPGKCIGGSHFGNYEGLLPEKAGRSYTECDIDTLGKSSRGAKRIVFSNDGLIYYTDDHYASFTLLYGEE